VVGGANSIASLNNVLNSKVFLSSLTKETCCLSSLMLIFCWQMSKQKIVLISGFGGTGKSAVAARVYDLLESNAVVEADELFHIKPFLIFILALCGQRSKVPKSSPAR
jgi:2-phosphoglycerate kinase